MPIKASKTNHDLLLKGRSKLVNDVYPGYYFPTFL